MSVRIASGDTSAKVSFAWTPGLSLGDFSVYYSKNGATAVAYTTPTVTEDATVAGLYHLTVDEGTTLASGRITEDYMLVFTHSDLPGQQRTRELELFRPPPIRKNQALANFKFTMKDTDGNLLSGLTVTATRSIDDGAFAACANSVVEISDGAYRLNLAAADLNGDVITLKLTATGAVAHLITMIPFGA